MADNRLVCFQNTDSSNIPLRAPALSTVCRAYRWLPSPSTVRVQQWPGQTASTVLYAQKRVTNCFAGSWSSCSRHWYQSRVFWACAAHSAFACPWQGRPVLRRATIWQLTLKATGSPRPRAPLRISPCTVPSWLSGVRVSPYRVVDGGRRRQQVRRRWLRPGSLLPRFGAVSACRAARRYMLPVTCLIFAPSLTCMLFHRHRPLILSSCFRNYRCQILGES